MNRGQIQPRLALTGRSPDARVAWHRGRAVTLGELLGDAELLCRRITETGGEPRTLINACRGRYAFLVGFVACLLGGRACLLPGDRSAQRSAGLIERYPDGRALVDEEGAADGWPSIAVPILSGAHGNPGDAAAAGDVLTTIAFTSGTTGDPVAHTRSWGSQVLQIDALAGRCGLVRPETVSVVATVPFGHMYGFELTILMPLRANVAIHTGTPLYAEDIRQALEAVPAPRVLVTSPFHLRALAALAQPMPAIARVISATAPLGAALAARIEQRFATEVHEIYGCTEAGSVATRRTLAPTARWHPVDGVRFSAIDADATAFQVDVPGMPAPVPLADVLALEPDGDFELLGRRGDLIKVGGRRGSLTALTSALLAVDGVLDGAVVMPDDAEAVDAGAEDTRATPTRPVALAVAPGVSAGDVLKALRARIDPAFVPRRVILLEALPRDAVGKLRKAEVDALLASRPLDEVSVPVTFAADHPSIPGHFPGRPIVPGVVVLDAIAREASEAFEMGRCDGVTYAKFPREVPPGSVTELALRKITIKRVDFEMRLRGEVVAVGELAFGTSPGAGGPERVGP